MQYIQYKMRIYNVCLLLVSADVVDVTNCDSLQDQYNGLYERNKKLHENVQLCSDLVVEMRKNQVGEGVVKSCGGGAKREFIDAVPHCDVSGSIEDMTVCQYDKNDCVV